MEELPYLSFLASFLANGDLELFSPDSQGSFLIKALQEIVLGDLENVNIFAIVNDKVYFISHCFFLKKCLPIIP